MNDLFMQFVLLFGIPATCFIGPGCALYFLSRRKRHARIRRRSPIGISLLRGPGHTLREQLDEVTSDLSGDVALLMVVPLLAVAMVLGSGHLHGVLAMRKFAIVPIVAVLAVHTYLIFKLVKSAAHLDNLRTGYDAEVAVGQELDQLMRQGAATFHDLPAANFNIDHVVIAREGVFAVETKGFTKPNRDRGREDATVVFDEKTLQFPKWTTREPLEQAERQAAWLGKWLSGAVGKPVRALPVVALPGWFVERKGRSDVRVFSGKELAGMLKSRGAQPLSVEDVERIAHQVEQRCRTVEPRYTGKSPGR